MIKTFKFFKNGNKKHEKSCFSVHNLEKAQKLSTGKNVKVGIVDWGFGDVNNPLFAGSFDATKKGFLNTKKEHGFLMATTLREIALNCEIFAINGHFKNSTDFERVCFLENATNFAIKNKIRILTYSHPPIKDKAAINKLKTLLKKASQHGIITIFIHCQLNDNLMPCPMHLWKKELKENMFSIFEYDFNALNPITHAKWLESEKKDDSCFLSASSTALILAGIVAMLLEQNSNLSKQEIENILNKTSRKQTPTQKVVDEFKALQFLKTKQAEVTFKNLSKNNKQVFQKTYVTALKQGFVDFVPTKMIANLNNNFENVFAEIKQNNWQAFLCLEKEKPIGVLIFGKTCFKYAKQTDAFLDSIYFLKNFHGKGFAQKSFEHAEKLLRQQGFKKLFLWCSIENVRAWKFYEKNGFKQTTKTWNDSLDGKVFHNILLSKNLD